MKQVATTADKPSTQIVYVRCPGCFKWILQANMIYYPPNYLDDHWDYELCARCDHIIKNGDYSDVQGVIGNIGSYAGWSSEVDTL